MASGIPDFQGVGVYIENWSMLFDLYILAITPIALTKTENAY